MCHLINVLFCLEDAFLSCRLCMYLSGSWELFPTVTLPLDLAWGLSSPAGPSIGEEGKLSRTPRDVWGARHRSKILKKCSRCLLSDLKYA